ncbi:Glycosyl hydrolases family 16 [Mariniphaga anaerophila]|uniref:Glycosyl hydrolases family 16 n=1 Tax=Mariniphaga anaerophila TaxID=1484053 RepID=A0A1M5G4Z7_9BACT|nr:glycoside hydrolase family 16 protein [Mariniphaga anaerophila]SHF98531.1 Glycosyl hydrolases family 16 [Mariniphaga anaerophila]
MKNTFAILALSTGLLFSCQVSEKKAKTESAPKNTALSQEVFDPAASGYKLVWEDNFDGSELDTTKWKIRGTGPRRIGYNDPSMVSVSDGCLNLMYDIKKDSIMGSAVGTYETFNTTYGYFECRGQLQKGVGPWAAFWMQSPEISNGEDPAVYGAEIDIFEYFNGLGKDLMTHCVHWAYGPNQKSVGQQESTMEGLSEGFHTFSLEWTPEKYAFYIDGLKFHELNEGLSHIDQYMILSMEIPATLEGIKNACAPDTFKVDYVKVYKK